MRFVVTLLALLALAGCNFKSGMDKSSSKAKEKKDEPAEVAQQPPVNPEPVAAPADKKGIIGKFTYEVVDYEKAMAENPNLIEIEPKAKGGDYLSFMASAYINVRAQVSMIPMQQELQRIKIVEDRNPTYDEIKKIMKDYQVQFTMLPRYQKYAYDAKKGRFTILEDPALHVEKK